MAKRKNTKSPSEPPSEPSPSEESPKVHSAADAVARAEAELKRAQETFQTVRREATERLRAVREKSVGDLIDGTLATVKKHPGPGVLVAIVIGFFLGRLFRR
ncbi:MAG: hypothetical protein V3R99_13235 [Thermoguttaceae bacterium]